MIGASKILTVSYGTFSCTLEGFDDPFNTMRAIAEYFRDLAAEDRYFGAEPPTPDAAMLHKIAEREINRRVEANIQENGVILRAGDIGIVAPSPVMIDAPPPAPTARQLAEITATQADSVASHLAEPPQPQADTVGTLVVDDGLDAQTDVLRDHDTGWNDPVAEDTAEDSIASVMADLGTVTPDQSRDAHPDDADLTPHAKQSSQDAADEDGILSAVATAQVADAEEIETTPTAHDGAADAAILDAASGAAVLAEPASVDENDAILEATLGAMIDPDGDDGFDLAPDAAMVPVAASEIFDLQPMATPDAALSAETAQDAQGITRRQLRARARVIKIRRIEPAAAAATAEVPRAVDAIVATAVPIDETPVSALSPEAEAELLRELADLEADLAPDALPQDLPSAEIPVAPVPDQGAEMPLAEARPNHAGPADDAVNRLISRTNAAMEGPENKRRLAAIAHLKAAVAATFADRKNNSGTTQPGPAERMDPYREDLDRVVRPRRPALVSPLAQDAANPTPRPQIEQRPAPLVLVSEQRIDKPASPAAPVSPVRPRRITTGLLASPTQAAQDGSTDEADEDGDLTADDVNNIFADPTLPFADFAEQLGATTMPELLEAAAAYCALQLGRDQFTRPLLLQQIAHLPDGGDFNREDCLRGFGTLLRDGRIQKIKRGQFKLSGQSRYLADAKRLAG